ncbi:MAG: TIGR02646 family protein [Haemophilus parainfluenzae]|jgi:TIGR02646 family protein|nr:retron system putative HNH endonuclease [uncultured Haemophilus sp.]MBS4797885.1 TIGR02646 family protein [Haemophilus parainfluenzae]
MIPITKKTNLPLILTKASKNHINYDDLEKTDIQESLLEEQGALCAYCMCRIDKDNMKIEHWNPQSIAPNLSLDYQNMLGVCKGGEGNSKKFQHCDTKKGNITISYNPADKDHIMKLKIKYDKDGSIYSEDDKFKNELNDVLNLNLPWLKENRKSALIGYQRAFNQKYERHVNDRATLEREISKLCSVNKEGKKEPYHGIILYFLNKKLKSAKL